jgi:hypothetical protein
MRMPSTEQLDTAIAWLRTNNGTNGEAGNCVAVAAWLDNIDQNRILRETAREAGVPVSRLRERLRIVTNPRRKESS